MQYAMMYQMGPEHFAARSNPETRDAFWGAFFPYFNAIKEAGIFVAGAGLEDPHTATSLRTKDGKRVIEDGPYAETKEQLGGIIVIDVPNLDVALEWANRYPMQCGSVEVRPALMRSPE